MTDPAIAVIAVNPHGFVEALTELKETSRTSAYAFHKGWWRDVRFFHRDGQRYEVVDVIPDRRRGLISHVLANSFYNPRFSATYNYRSTGRYRLVDLHEAVKAAIGGDDDVLTQFHTEEELLARLGRTSSFDEMVGFVRYMQAPDDAA